MVILTDRLNIQILDDSEEDKHSPNLIFGEKIRNAYQLVSQPWHGRLKTMAGFNQKVMKQEETNALLIFNFISLF